MSSLKSTRKNNLNSLVNEDSVKKASSNSANIVTIQQKNATYVPKDSVPNLDNKNQNTTIFDSFNLEEVDLRSDLIQSISEANNEDSYLTLSSRELSNINKNINREFLTSKNYLNLEFDLLSNNKDNLRDLNDIVDKKNEIIESLFKNVENQFKSVLKRINNYKYVKNKIEEKIRNEKELINNLNNGLTLRKDVIDSIDLSKKLRNRLTGNEAILGLNLITNYFIENYEKVDLKQLNNQKENKFSLNTEEYSSDIKIVGNISQISQLNLMLDFNTTNDNTLSDSTGLVIQNFINNSRSLYTLMPNCILDIDVDNKQYSKKINSKDFIVFSKEIQNIEIWNSINVNKQKVVHESLLDENNISINNSKFILSGDINDINNSTISVKKIQVNQNINVSNPIAPKSMELKGEINSEDFDVYNGDYDLLSKINSDDNSYLSLLSSGARDLINTCLANRAEFVPYLSAYSENNLINEETRLTREANHSFLREVDILSGKFYSQSMSQENNLAQRYIFGNNNAPATIFNINGTRSVSTPIDSLRPITNSFKNSTRNNIFNIFYQNLTMFETIRYGRLKNNLTAAMSLGTLFESNNTQFRNNLSKFYNNNIFNYVDFKLKIDSLVKSVKLERLSSLGIDIKPFNDIIKNIKRSKNKLLFSEYSHDDKEMTSILNEENILFKSLFTKNEQEEYVNNISFNYKNSYINKKFYKANVTNVVPDNDGKVIEIMSNYYPSGQFFSTTSFLLKLLNNFNNYVKKFNNKEKERNEIITEMFYMHYFSNSNNADVLNSISKRFIFNSIFNDKSVYSNYKSRIKSYQYDNTVFDGYKEKINKELKDFSGSDEEIRNKAESILLELSEQYLGSNDDLKLIRNEVYKDEMIQQLSDEYDYKLVFANNFFESIISESMSGKIVTLQQVFPFTVHADSKKIRVPTNQDSFADTKHKIFYIYKKLPSLNLIKRQNEFIIEDENNDAYFNNKNISFDIIFDRIKRGDAEGERIFFENSFEEKFEVLCRDKNSIFGMICETIREMLSIVDITYSELNLMSEDEISSYIDSNKKLIEMVKEIVQIFANVYQSIIKNIMFDYTMTSFNHLIKPYQYTDNSSLLSDSFLTGDVSASLILDIFNLSNSNNNTEIFRSTFEKIDYNLEPNNGISKSIEVLINEITRSDNKIKVNQDNIDFNNILYKSTNDNIFYRKMLQVINDIIRSDVSQAMSFDITRSVFKQHNLINENISDIKNQYLLDFVEKINIDEDDFFEKINNKYYQNALIRNINNIEKRNESLSSVKNSLIQDPESFLQNENLFDQVKSERLYKQIEYNTNNIYSFSIKTEDVSNSNRNILIKITIQPRDVAASDRLYLPIVYYFTTNFLSLNNNIHENDSHLFVENENLSNEIYSDLDYTKLSLNRSDIIDDNISNRIKEVISNKISSNQEKINIIYDNIIENHRKSHILKKIASAKFDINVNNNNNNDRKELTDVLSVIPDNVISNIFKTTKQEIYQNIDDIKHFNEYYEMNNAVNYLFSAKFDNDNVLNTKIYDRYLLNLPANLLYAVPRVEGIPNLNNNLIPNLLNVDFNSIIQTARSVNYIDTGLDLLTKLSLIETDLRNDNKMNFHKTEFNNNRKTLMFAIKMELL